MNEQNDGQKQASGTCGPGCNCGATGSGWWRVLVGGAVLLVAGVLVARAVMKDNGAAAVSASTGFAALPAPAQTPAAIAADNPATTDTIKEIAALAELNTVAGDAAGVFVFLPGTNEVSAKFPTAQLQGAVRTMAPQLNGGKIGIYTLKAGSRDYAQVAAQIAVPGVLVMVKGRGMAPVTGEITETKLIQGFAAASSAGGCGPAASGCGPKGCK